MKITVEAPRKKISIVQCTRCQSYGHTKTYCARPFVCVKCGGDHDTAEYTKDPASTPTCALCGGAHSANSKGCDVYRRLQTARCDSTPRPRRPDPRTPTPHVDTSDAYHFPPLLHSHPPDPPLKTQFTYSHVVASGSKTIDLGVQLSVFLTELKSLFSQLMQQTSTILNMLMALLLRLTAYWLLHYVLLSGTQTVSFAPVGITNISRYA